MSRILPYNHEKQIMFFHIPKNAGTFIKNILEKECNMHPLNVLKIFLKKYPKGNSHPDEKEFDEERKLFYNEMVENHMNMDLNEYNKISGGIYNFMYKHENYKKLSGLSDDKWKTYTKLAVVRNPYDRFISGIMHVLRLLNRNSKRINSGHIDDNLSDIGFFIEEKKLKYIVSYEMNEVDASIIEKFIEERDQISYLFYWHIYENQNQHLYIDDISYNTKIITTPSMTEFDSLKDNKYDNFSKTDEYYVLRYENIMQELYYLLIARFDYKKSFEEFNKEYSEKKNESPRTKSIIEYYNENIFNFVNEWFSDDFEKLNYEKYETFEDFCKFIE